MNKKSRLIFLLKLCLLSFFLQLSLINIAWSQSPTHFKIGEKSFAKIDIYSILQTKEGKLYIATNDGVYIKHYNLFNRIATIKKQKGNSFFGLKENHKGDIFCHNLSGQIFKITNNKIQLHYQIEKDELVNSPEFFFNKKDELLIFGKNFFKLNSKFEKEILLDNKVQTDSKTTIFFRPMQMWDGTIVCTYSYGDSKEYMLYKNNKIEVHNYEEINWQQKNKTPSGSLSGFNLNNDIIYMTEYNKFSGPNKVSMLNNSRRKVYQISDNLLLSLDSKKGINFWELKNKTLSQNKTLFPNTFISAYHYNDEGVLFLGTFGEGIIVVPNFNTLEINIESSLRGIDVYNNKTIISSRDGIIYEYQTELNKIAERKINLDEIFSLKKEYNFLPEPNLVSSYGSFNSIPIIKDVAEADSGFFIATNNGIFYASENLKNKEISSFQTKPYQNNTARLHGNIRYSSLIYANDMNEIYFSNLEKIEYIKGKNKAKELLLEGESIPCNDLAYHKNKIIIATPEKGVLFFQNHKHIFSLNYENGLSSNKIKKLKLVDDWLYILTENNIQVYDIKKDKLTFVSTENGVIDNFIINFSADKKNLWLLKSKSFIKIPTSSISFEKQMLNFVIDSITSDEEIIKNKASFDLNSEQNKFLLFLSFNDIIKARDAEFQIKKDQEKWITYPATQNEIEIQNFGYGKHNLSIRLKYENEYYDTKEISFYKSAPIYYKWWFYPLIILIIVVIIVLFFRQKLVKQSLESRRKNELNGSKLRAIQSQMNPHFIFNALNSIQYLVIKQDTDSAYSYITRFANLIRKTLDYSEKKTISIRQEIELLELYLNLEKLRFKEDFEYKIIKKNISDIQIPPMLIQPFIENSLVHGLLHKNGLKLLTVDIEVFDDFIRCKVEDNGIGREEANKIKKRQKGEHESFALNAINNRFRILNENSVRKLGYVYEDFPEGENDISTRVIVTIPIKQNN